MSWLVDWWAGHTEAITAERREREAEDADRVPAYYWLNSPGPVSFVASALTKLRPVFNLDRLHRNVLEMYARTEQKQEAREQAQDPAPGAPAPGESAVGGA